MKAKIEVVASDCIKMEFDAIDVHLDDKLEKPFVLLDRDDIDRLIGALSIACTEMDGVLTQEEVDAEVGAIEWASNFEE